MQCNKKGTKIRYFIILVITLFILSSLLSNSTIIASLESNENIPPIANGGTVTTVEIGEEVYFSALGSIDPDGEIVMYQWDFNGDGIYDWKNKNNGTTTHVYEIPKAYNATLSVTDNNGTISTDVYFVLVLSPESEKKELDPRVRSILTAVGIGEVVFGVILLVSMYRIKKEEENEGNGKNNTKNTKE